MRSISTSAEPGPGGWVRSGLYVLVLGSLTVIGASDLTGWELAGFICLGILIAAASLLRVRYPYVLLVLAWLAAAFATQVFLIPALFNLGVRRRDTRSRVALMLTVILLLAVAPRGERLVSVDGIEQGVWAEVGSWVLNVVAVVVAPYLIGSAIAARRDLTDSYRLRAQHAEAERSARATEAVLLERARIAREAHDVLGHKLSLLTMQAGGLALHTDAGPQVVEEQAQLIRQSARDALDDLRAIIGSIETTDVPEDQAASHSLLRQDIDGIVMLVNASRVSGAIVDLSISPEIYPDSLPQESSRAAYRIVQECLTNAHRHAPGAPVIISVTGAPGDALVVEVRNAVTVPTPGESASGGRGLPGLRERARFLGGELTVTEADSVFIVRAQLPWHSHDDRTVTSR